MTTVELRTDRGVVIRTDVPALLLSIREASELLGLSPNIVRRLIADGALETVEVGAAAERVHRRIKLGSLLALCGVDCASTDPP